MRFLLLLIPLLFFVWQVVAAEFNAMAPAILRLDRLEPREALPAGGDIVTVIGAGLTKDTKILFGGKPAELVEFIDVTRVKVKVPAGNVGRAEIVARAGDSTGAGSPDFGYAPHPYLLIQAAELPGLREKFNKPAFSGYHDIILSAAQQQLKVSSTAPGRDTQTRIESLMWGYVFTGEKAYKDALMGALTKPIFNTNPDSHFQFMDAMMIAEVYDFLFPDLAPEERTRLEGFLDTHLNYYAKWQRDWFFHNPSNTVAVGYSGAGMAALALMHSTSAAKKVIDEAYAGNTAYLKTCLSSDGGYIEGNLYWNYALTNYLQFAHGYAHAIGSEKGLLDNALLKMNYRFIETQLGGDRNLFTFCDTQPWLTGAAICSDLGHRFNQPLMTWMSDYMAHNLGTPADAIAAPENSGCSLTALALLWRADSPPVKEFPGVPTLSYLEKMNWGVLRSDSTFVPGLVVGVKGSMGTLSHHKQNDLGSFVLQAHGESFLIDPGYFQERETAHTLPLVDGHGPDFSGSTIGDTFEKGTLRSMVVDSTKAYARAKCVRVRRNIVMISDKAVVVLDDIVPVAGQPGKITAQFQCGFKTELSADKKSATISGVKSRLMLRICGPALELKADGARDFKKSWVFKKLADDGKVSWSSLSGNYTADAGNPLVTVLFPLEGTAEAPKVDVQNTNDTITVAWPGQDPIRFSKNASGWSFVHP